MTTTLQPTVPDWIAHAPTGHLILQLLTGATAAQSCIKYPFASYYLYVPSIHPLSKQKVGEAVQLTALPVVVCVHGSGRDAAAERDRWQQFAETHGCMVVSPLFPIDLTVSMPAIDLLTGQHVDGVDNYKRLVYHTVYYDEVLLQILQEISDIWGSVEISRFNLVGFSGGGQFAHRFFYLHPDRLKSVGIGAPGNATYLDSTVPWPRGCKDVEIIFRRTINFNKLRSVPVQLFIGDADTYHTVNFDGCPAPLSRYGVMEKLHHNFEELGIPHAFDVEPGVAHRGDLLMHLTQPFVLKHLH